MALVRAGLLAAQPARPGRKTPEWLLPLSSIDSLFSRIRKTVRPLTADTAGTDVNLNQFASMPRGAALGGIVGLVSAICEGRLLVQAEGDDVRFSALNVSTPSEGPGVPASAQPRKVTVKELASAWGMYPDVIYRLMKAGLLAFNLGDDGRRKHVDRRDAASFESRYIVVTQLARTLRVNPTNLSDRLIDAGLVPVSGPKVDKGLVYVFRRDDLSRLNLREVLSRPTYRSRAGRPRSGSSRRTPHDDVVDSTTAARMLDLSVQQLSRVVRGGYLPEHEDSRTKGNRRYLYRRDVENYRAAFISSSELQPLDDAAADLKCTRRQFFIRFVRSGRIAVEKAPHGETYVRRAQVEAVAARVAR
ncbi:hypothetical protein [Sinimarinibacterium flocculans]|uniref:hypothetical protein n=1 Tax=Sinimarinibacterium flocculans TaxID=985250 RepID=UPI003514ED22